MDAQRIVSTRSASNRDVVELISMLRHRLSEGEFIALGIILYDLEREVIEKILKEGSKLAPEVFRERSPGEPFL